VAREESQPARALPDLFRRPKRAVASRAGGSGVRPRRQAGHSQSSGYMPGSVMRV
jgi:hypothetical protein